MSLKQLIEEQRNAQREEEELRRNLSTDEDFHHVFGDSGFARFSPIVDGYSHSLPVSKDEWVKPLTEAISLIEPDKWETVQRPAPVSMEDLEKFPLQHDGGYHKRDIFLDSGPIRVVWKDGTHHVLSIICFLGVLYYYQGFFGKYTLSKEQQGDVDKEIKQYNQLIRLVSAWVNTDMLKYAVAEVSIYGYGGSRSSAYIYLYSDGRVFTLEGRGEDYKELREAITSIHNPDFFLAHLVRVINGEDTLTFNYDLRSGWSFKNSFGHKIQVI